MSTGGIIIGSGQIYSSNPCAEVALGPPQYLKKRCLGSEDNECTVPTCIECGCPDLIGDDPTLWECMSCGHKSISAVLIRPEVAENWRPPDRQGIIDLWLTS